MRATQIETTPCCNSDPEAVKYNSHNKVVQCHKCGHVWEPMGGPVPVDLHDLFDYARLKNTEPRKLPTVIASLGDPYGRPLQVVRSTQDLDRPRLKGKGAVNLVERAIAALRRGSIGVVFLNINAVLDRLGDRAFKTAYPDRTEEHPRDPASDDHDE